MSASPSTVRESPVRYEPSMEVPEPGEAETQVELNETLSKIREKTYADGGHALRSVHAKSHGLLRGEIQILSGLPPQLAQGLFARPGTYGLVMRLSTTPGDILDDSVSTPRGMAIKIVGVEGERLSVSEGDATQDFVLINGPVFLKKEGKAFLKSLKLLAVTTDQAPGLKKVMSAALRGAESVIEKLGGESPTLIGLGGHPETHPLGDTYYTATPLLYGEYMAKLSVAPVSPELTALTKKTLNVNGKPNGLREGVIDFFAQYGGEWELRAQLCTNLKSMPIEDSTVQWPEHQSPYVTVARIVVPPQQGWSEARSKVVDEGYSFSPWHALAAHRPLGSINRLRRLAYEKSRQFRARHTGRPTDEPRTLERLPD
ncbi:MAG: catalase family protein [Gammaproteobacteria bacterium]